MDIPTQTACTESIGSAQQTLTQGHNLHVSEIRPVEEKHSHLAIGSRHETLPCTEQDIEGVCKWTSISSSLSTSWVSLAVGRKASAEADTKETCGRYGGVERNDLERPCDSGTGRLKQYSSVIIQHGCIRLTNCFGIIQCSLLSSWAFVP